MRFHREEIERGELSPESVRAAADQIMANGYVIIESAIHQEKISNLRTAFMDVFERHVREVKVDDTPVNSETKRGSNRFRMYMPFTPPFLDDVILANPLAMPIIDALLGRDCNCVYYSADTPLPGSDVQGVHSDTPPLFPDSDVMLPPYELVVNIPLVDFTEQNGPIEIWPGGTHRVPESMMTPKRVQEVAQFLPSKRVLIPAGSILIRDIRMWHRGTENRSDAARPMLALIYARPWLWRGDQQGKIGITPEIYETLSPRAQELFRLEVALQTR